ncbi:MAG: hypothetical protein WC712_06340 [Candidatus Brocadiia bacterium]
MSALERIPGWAGGLALSVLILVLGAWGGFVMSSLRDDARRISEVREVSASVNTRLDEVQEQLRDIKTEVHRMSLEVERLSEWRNGMQGVRQ